MKEGRWKKDEGRSLMSDARGKDWEMFGRRDVGWSEQKESHEISWPDQLSYQVRSLHGKKYKGENFPSCRKSTNYRMVERNFNCITCSPRLIWQSRPQQRGRDCFFYPFIVKVLKKFGGLLDFSVNLQQNNLEYTCAVRRPLRNSIWSLPRWTVKSGTGLLFLHSYMHGLDACFCFRD